jgi:hypothetical protein
MLLRYNTEAASPTYDSPWTRSAGLLNPSKDNSDDHYIPDLPPPVSLPRAKVATVQRHPISTMFHSWNSLQSQSEYVDHSHQQPISEYNEDLQYNIPLQERFHHQKIPGVRKL